MATYRPDPAAGWLAAVRGGVVLVAPSDSAAEVAALWPNLVESDPTPKVLDALAANGLAATPPFALVVRDADGGSARVVVRGALSVRAGDVTVSGVGVSTWAERMVEVGDAEIQVEVEGASPDAAAGRLPLVEGVVHAEAVSSGDREPVAPVRMPTAASVPAVPVAPVPAASVPSPIVPTFPAPPAALAEQTIVPAEDTVAGPSTPPHATPALPEAPPAPYDGDHDGLTVASVDLRRLRAERASRGGEATPAGGVTVPPASSSLRMPDGSVEAIGHEVVLGRAPSVSQVSGGRIPRLITLGAGDPDISRNHLRVAVEGDTVVVTDLHSRNGTHVVAPGKPPVKLRAGDPTPVLAGTVVDLGGGWTIQVIGA
ncbi:FHA domain-containing protein [Agromyces sp. Soil535]|uniref:FHA domain-containing protein n=1 Tax=Agromyces sp. Soil535 TaxID=1736390 RepID=UPI0006FAE1F2|nr:FHA domain-containing protein [Agromyces sp. Soil535]KRE28544.1 hypothetical protein ASG80_21160 [Agromyces sp. Soil535]